MGPGAAFIGDASQPDVNTHYFNFMKLDEAEKEASRNNATLARRVLDLTYRLAARSWDSHSSSGASWTLFPPSSADESSAPRTLCMSSSSGSGNYWSTEGHGEERGDGDAPATLVAQDSGGSVASTPKGTPKRTPPCERARTKELTLQQYLRGKSEHSRVELADVTFSSRSGTVELTKPELLVAPPRPRARSTSLPCGPTWQQGGGADLAATTARDRQKESGELNADTQDAIVAPTYSVPWAPRLGRRSLSAADLSKPRCYC